MTGRRGNDRRDGAGNGVPHAWQRPVLITGGAGFIGSNLAHRLLATGHPVVLFDNLAREGVRRNLAWLHRTHGANVEIEVADVRDRVALRHALRWCSQVYHFAAQVAVTTSLVDPREDFEVNALGTLNLLEALRSLRDPPPLVFTSTNKVYGALDDIRLRRTATRWQPRDRATREVGIGERRALQFCSPYGCSKGTADQYVLDYARSFGLQAVVFRMSCIYGPRQCGTEDQGWVAHFLLRTLENRPIDIFGDGLQVRDLLYVDDLVEALLHAQAAMPRLSGRAFNIGGGPANSVSLVELLELIVRLRRLPIETRHHEWRVGDQRYYVSDTTAFREATGWRPAVSVQDGVARLYQWLLESRRDGWLRDQPSRVASVPGGNGDGAPLATVSGPAA